jgi:endonuclease/exonuclease/phosphatase family metal-dependent hydrolase
MRITRAAVLLLLTLLTLPAFSQRVMTRNLYLGADLAPALAATDFNTFQTAAKTIWTQVHATNFPERAKAIADEIRRDHPYLVGLQEVTLWRTGPLLNSAPATDVKFDFLELLLAELRARGTPYSVESTVTNFDLEVPLVVDFVDVRMTDRDVILVRADVSGRSLTISNPQSSTYNTFLPINVLGTALEVRRGWTSLDVDIAGEKFRFINTHLEAFAPQVRDAQAAELLAGPVNTTMPVVLVGDLNAVTTDAATYGRIAAAGFSDVWLGSGGVTCCQAAGLDNATSMLDQRIDYILFRGITLHKPGVVGDKESDKVAGLWPSDHAGVTAQIKGGPRRRAVAR